MPFRLVSTLRAIGRDSRASRSLRNLTTSAFDRSASLLAEGRRNVGIESEVCTAEGSMPQRAALATALLAASSHSLPASSTVMLFRGNDVFLVTDLAAHVV